MDCSVSGVRFTVKVDRFQVYQSARALSLQSLQLLNPRSPTTSKSKKFPFHVSSGFRE